MQNPEIEAKLNELFSDVRKGLPRLLGDGEGAVNLARNQRTLHARLHELICYAARQGDPQVFNQTTCTQLDRP